MKYIELSDREVDTLLAEFATLRDNGGRLKDESILVKIKLELMHERDRRDSKRLRRL